MAGAVNLKAGMGSASRFSPRTNGSDEGGMVDRRRWTSFLTWAFVLAEMAGRDGILPTAAHAGEDHLGRVAPAGYDTAPIVNNLPNISVSTATEGPQPIAYQHAATMPAYAPTALSSELGEAKIAPIVDVLAHSQRAAAGGGYGSSVDGMSAGDADGTHIALGGEPFSAFNLAGQPLDLGLHIDLSDTTYGLLGGLADGLANLPLVGAWLDDVGNSLTSTTSNLVSSAEPVVSLLGLHGDTASASGSDVAAPGALSFAGSASPAGGDELATPSGGYTDYGITLNLGAVDVAHATGEAAVHADALGAMFDSAPLDTHLGGESDALHLDQSVLRTASDILA